MLNASVGVERVLGRLRRPRRLGPDPATTLHTQTLVIARRLRGGARSLAAASPTVPVHHRRRTLQQAARRERVGFVGRFGSDRIVAFAVAGIVFGASVASVAVAGPSDGRGVGGPTGDGAGPRLAIGGSAGLERDDYIDDATELTSPPDDYLDRFVGIDSIEPQIGGVGVAGLAPAPEAGLEIVSGPFLDDGTLLKPIAVDTTVEDGSELLRKYKVKSGDTLVGIARKFDISMMTLWWANDLRSKDELHQGQILVVPPVSGLVVTVTPNDTLDSIAAKFKVKTSRIMKTNSLTDPNLVVGQVLVVPGAKGKPIPTPKPTKRPSQAKPRSSGGGGGGGSARPPVRYGGGNFAWPVVGGGNQISQYYHYGHYGIDVSADYGSRVRSAAGGTVIFAGWRSNGGGYQVWIAHGSGLYTTYNHMSAVTVGRGQHVGRAQSVGRVGQSGNATGPHLHFEVWKGPVWDGGRRVNPLAYL